MLKLYNQYGVLKASIEPDDSSQQAAELQLGNELSLSFTMYECMVLEVNDYIDFEGSRFWVLEQCYPNQTTTIEWEYNVMLYGVESIVQRYLMLKISNGEYEPIFSVTKTARGHLELIVAALNDAMGITDWKVGEVVSTAYIVIDYNCTYINEALSNLAGKAETEYWFENGMTINLTQAEHGAEITLAYGNGLLNLYREKADNVAFFSRLIPIGSSRNIVYDDYGYTRLQLPDKAKYIDIDVEKYGVIHHAEIKAFSDIYPRRIGTISSVRSKKCVNENGDIFYVYYVKDDTLNFDPNDYILDGLVINMTFQTGDLSGRDFEVNYNSTTKEFEIINQYPYDDSSIQLPGSLLMEEGDTYILWNLEMPSEYITLAENEYKEAVYAFIEKNLKDIGIYKGTTDYVELERRDIMLTVGQRIRLESAKYFPSTGYNLSRITKITRNVNQPKTIEIEISDVLSTGLVEKVNNDLTEVKNYTEQAVSNLPDVVKSWESTPAADTNLFSSLKSAKEFLSKKYPDTAQGLIRFLKGIEIGEAIDSMLAGKGIVADENGRLQLSRLEVRDSMTVNEIIYNRQSAMEGDFIFSEAGTIESIEEVESDTFEVAIRKDYDFDFTALEEGDIVRGVVNNLQSETKEYYTSWCRVIEKDTSANTLTLVQYDDDEVPGGKNYPPTKLMKLNRWGNTTNKRRQRVWFISSYDGQIVWLTGVNKPILEIWNYASTWGLPPNFLTADGNLPLNPDQPYFYARGAVIQDLIRVDYQGKPLMELVDRGVWNVETAADEDVPYLFEEYNETTMRYESHEVWHNSIKWRCLSSRTTEEPRWNSSDWEALSGNFEMSIEPTGGQRFFRGSNVYTTLTATLYNGDADISADVEDSQVEWTRVSSKSDEDLAWNILRAGAGLALEITPLDLPSDWLETRQVSYKCSVAIRETTVTNTFNINK